LAKRGAKTLDVRIDRKEEQELKLNKQASIWSQLSLGNPGFARNRRELWTATFRGFLDDVAIRCIPGICLPGGNQRIHENEKSI
jgi:hypothetical protein